MYLIFAWLWEFLQQRRHSSKWRWERVLVGTFLFLPLPPWQEEICDQIIGEIWESFRVRPTIPARPKNFRPREKDIESSTSTPTWYLLSATPWSQCLLYPFSSTSHAPIWTSYNSVGSSVCTPFIYSHHWIKQGHGCQLLMIQIITMSVTIMAEMMFVLIT